MGKLVMGGIAMASAIMANAAELTAKGVASSVAVHKPLIL